MFGGLVIFCNFYYNIISSFFVALEIGMSLPSIAVCNRWMGEPVRALVISTDIFVINRRGMFTRIIFFIWEG